jgi:hypothetical protein
VPLIGYNLPVENKFAILLLKTSSARQNSRGERGSPCLTPLEQLKNPSDLPLMEIDKKDNLRITCILLHKTSLKPKFLRTFSKKDHSKVSKTFEIKQLFLYRTS